MAPSSRMVSVMQGCGVSFGFICVVPLWVCFCRVWRCAQNCWGVGGGFSFRVKRYAFLVWPGVGIYFSVMPRVLSSVIAWSYSQSSICSHHASYVGASSICRSVWFHVAYMIRTNFFSSSFVTSLPCFPLNPKTFRYGLDHGK